MNHQDCIKQASRIKLLSYEGYHLADRIVRDGLNADHTSSRRTSDCETPLNHGHFQISHLFWVGVTHNDRLDASACASAERVPVSVALGSRLFACVLLVFFCCLVSLVSRRLLFLCVLLLLLMLLLPLFLIGAGKINI